MKTFILLSFFVVSFSYAKTLTLSKDVFKRVPFSTLYSEDGALIRNVDYFSVNALIPQLNSLYKLNLEDRREAHITVITPPDFKSGLTKLFTVNEMLNRYSASIQGMPFHVVCVGSRTSSDRKKQVFYLVVKSNKLSNIRFDLAKEAKLRAAALNIPLVFKPENFYPHITIGYVNDDVFEFSKEPESCLKDVKLVIK